MPVSLEPNRNVVLFGTVTGAPIRSMERYAESLMDALPAFGWTPRHVHGRMPRFPERNRFARILARELAPRVLYGWQARRERADLFHVIDHSLGYLVNALPRERTVVTCHDLTPLRMPELFGNGPGRSLGLYLFRQSVRTMTRAAHVICVSEFTRQDVINRLGLAPDRTSVVPMGVSEIFHAYPTATRLVTRSRLGFPEDACLVLHVGHAGMTKNVETVIQTVAILRSRGVPAWFIKVGPIDPHQTDIMKETGVRDYCRTLSAQSDEALCDVYNACDVLLFPSLCEGFGWPPLEAMRCGLPVIISTAPALIEMAGGLASAFSPEDATSMAHAVEALWRCKAQREEQTAAARRHAESFTCQRTIKSVAAVYSRLASQ